MIGGDALHAAARVDVAEVEAAGAAAALGILEANAAREKVRIADRQVRCFITWSVLVRIAEPTLTIDALVVAAEPGVAFVVALAATACDIVGVADWIGSRLGAAVPGVWVAQAAAPIGATVQIAQPSFAFVVAAALAALECEYVANRGRLLLAAAHVALRVAAATGAEHAPLRIVRVLRAFVVGAALSAGGGVSVADRQRSDRIAAVPGRGARIAFDAPTVDALTPVVGDRIALLV